jgi:hypothetical protein
MSIEEDRQVAVGLQLAVVDHDGSAYVEACPGAGKTRTLVQRVERLSRMLAPRKGIAVLSFTNTAVDEFEERCNSQGILERLGYPNFIGTFDGFLNQFLVMPFGVPGCERRPVIVDSWDGIEVTHGIGGVAAHPIKLSRFDATTGKIDLSLVRDPRIVAAVQPHQSAYEEVARRRRRALNTKGLLCADDARLVVKRFLSDQPEADAIGKALAARFSEVIVDEAQDCNADDVEVLQWLRRHGIPLVVLCDPDQAIFGFRKGTNEALRTFVHDFPPLTMKGNFRSSKVICSAAGSMRARGTTDLAVGDYHDTNHPIILMPYGKTARPDIGVKFMALAADLGVTDCMVLAHKRRVAEQASGTQSQFSGSGGKLARLAQLVVDFQSAMVTGRQREAKLRSAIRLLMEIEGKDADEVASLRPLVESPELDRVYRRKAIDVLAGLPVAYTGIGIDGWADRARALVTKLVKLPEGKTIKQVLRNGNDWHKELETTPVAGLPCATVHEAKGHDYEGVCLVLEKESEGAVTAWETRASSASEALRVLYVGATRAKRFLVIAVPTKLLVRVQTILTTNKVDCRTEDLSAATPRARRNSGG